MASIPPPPVFADSAQEPAPRKRGLPWWAWLLIAVFACSAPCAILAAILLPYFAQARMTAQFTQTVSNTKQVGTALMIYAVDFDDRLPLANWQDSLEPYTIRDTTIFTDPFRQAEGGENGLAFHERLVGAFQLNISDPQSSAMIYLTTQPGPNAVGDGSDVRFPRDSATVIGFADTSTRRIPKEEFDSSVFTYKLENLSIP